MNRDALKFGLMEKIQTDTYTFAIGLSDGTIIQFEHAADRGATLELQGVAFVDHSGSTDSHSRGPGFRIRSMEVDLEAIIWIADAAT